MSHLQNEWRWVIALALFFLERDLILETMFALIEIVIRLTRQSLDCQVSHVSRLATSVGWLGQQVG